MSKGIFNGLNNNIDFSFITKKLNVISKHILIPRFITNTFRTQEEQEARLAFSSKFDNLDILVKLIKIRYSEMQNSISDIEKSIDRNRIKIDELKLEKNNKISFYEYSQGFTNPDFDPDTALGKSLPVSTSGIDGIIANVDSGFELTEQVINDKSFIKIDLTNSKMEEIKFVSDSSVKIQWNPHLKAYEVLQNDIFQYNSEQDEQEIEIVHNLDTRALDIKLFKYDPDNELRYPIFANIEYPSSNKLIIHLSSPQRISMLLARI